MRLSTACNHYERLRNRLHNIIACAVYDHPTHAAILAQVKSEVWSDPGLARCPSWVRAHLGVCLRYLSNDLYRHLRWYHVGSDGKQYASFTDLPEAEKAMWRSDKQDSSYFWIKRHRTTTTNGNIETIVETITPTLHRF